MLGLLTFNAGSAVRQGRCAGKIHCSLHAFSNVSRSYTKPRIFIHAIHVDAKSATVVNRKTAKLFWPLAALAHNKVYAAAGTRYAVSCTSIATVAVDVCNFLAVAARTVLSAFSAHIFPAFGINDQPSCEYLLVGVRFLLIPQADLVFVKVTNTAAVSCALDY